jgi:excinuclease ABC subunit C
MLYESLRKRLPNLPGVYFMKDDASTILYVGKAKDLKKRVASYFVGKRSPKTQALIEHVTEVEFIVTDNELEALLLENNLIKQHQPKYNIDLKTNIRYAYICLTDEPFPRIMTARKKTWRGTYYGPYVNGWLRVQLIRVCIDIFKLRICRVLPKRACLQHHIGKCDAPCIGNISQEAYMDNVRLAKRVLDGKTEEIEEQLEADMKRFAANREFEKAAERKTQLELLRNASYNQKVELQRQFDQDVFATLLVDDMLKVEVFSIKKGVIAKREKFSVPVLGEQTFSDFLSAYYETHLVPEELIIDQELDDCETLEVYFSNIAGRRVSITKPKQGEKKQLLDMARQNAQVDFQEDFPELAELSRVLKLKTLPKVIECFDISHMGAEDVVAASIQYVDGKPNPEQFRRYAIQTVQGQDDFRSMFEVVFRRYRKLRDEGTTLPDLVVIDGGKQQLAFARKALQEVGVEIPIIALAKKEEEIYLPYLRVPLQLPKSNPALKLLMRIRDSTHNYVLKYQRVKRSKRMLMK